MCEVHGEAHVHALGHAGAVSAFGGALERVIGVGPADRPGDDARGGVGTEQRRGERGDFLLGRLLDCGGKQVVAGRLSMLRARSMSSRLPTV